MADIIHRPTVDGLARIRLRDQNDATHAEVVDFPARLLTGTTSPRLRVDVGETGFFERRMFRTYYEFNIPVAGPSRQFRFTSPVNFILWEQSVELDQGAIRWEVFTGATSTGTWTALPIIGQNRMTEVAAYTPVCTVETGGDFTGGTAVDLLRIRSTAVNNQATNVGNSASSERGLPAGTYHIRASTLAGGLPVNDSAQGVAMLRWEERP